MHCQILALFLASSILAVPLNINLGAYSPALVVGDGEISFSGGAEAGARNAAALFETLATGAQAGSQASNPQGQAATLTGTTQAAPVPAQGQGQAPGQGQGQGQGQANGGTGEANQIADSSAPSDQAPDQSPPTNGVIQNISKKVLQPITKRSFAIRDIQGFRESLAFAKEAMKNTPDIELGTDAAGVGIKQNAGIAVPVGSAAAGPRVGKRDVVKRDAGIDGEEGRMGITLIALAEI